MAPTSSSDPSDVFHVTAFTAQQIRDGAMSRMMDLWSGNLRRMAELRRRFGSVAAAAAEGLLVREQVEIYGLSSDGAADSAKNAAALGERYGADYHSIEFLNDAALRLCREFEISLPPLLGQVTRAELPSDLDVIVQFPTCTVFTVTPRPVA